LLSITDADVVGGECGCASAALGLEGSSNEREGGEGAEAHAIRRRTGIGMKRTMPCGEALVRVWIMRSSS
jgi:hypothetical protein